MPFNLFKRNKTKEPTTPKVLDLRTGVVDEEEVDPGWDYSADVDLPEPGDTYEEITQMIINEGWIPDGQFEPFSTFLREQLDELGMKVVCCQQLVTEKGEVKDVFIYGSLDRTTGELYLGDGEDEDSLLWAETQ